MNIDFIDILNNLGIVSFAVSGALAGIHKKFDFFGVLIISLVTSIGGGTLRDVLIGETPVFWLLNTQMFFLILASALFAIFFRKRLSILRTSLFLFDTIGIGLFTLVGIEKGVDLQLHPIICIALGTITACFGGVLRDILCNEIPVIFRKEIYATACISGGLVFFGLRFLNVPDNLVFIVATITIIAIRLLAVIKHWTFPPIEMD
nr:trimeric intracellular cation channel family protein [uncultured Flavobacterium sp.]